MPHSSTPAPADARRTTAVVGGGILGMTLALRLAERGEPVTLYEAAPELGGLAAAWTLGDVTWDRHYHVTLFSDLRTRALLADLGLEGDLRWAQVGTGFYSGGRFHPMNGALDFLRFPPLGLADKLRLGLTILYGSRIADGTRLESIPVERWLRRLSGDRTFETIWRPLLVAKLGDRYRDATAAFIWATIVRLYAARRAGLGAERFGSVRGGYARVLAALEAALVARGVELRAGTPVARVESAPGGGGVRVETAAGGAREHARAVVTVAAPLAARMIPALEGDERARLAEKLYGGIVCASVLLDEPLGPYYVTNLTDGWVPFSAVIDMANVVGREAFGGGALVYLPKYVRPDDPLFERSDGEIEATFLAALERMYPAFSRERVRSFRVSRVRRVFPIPTHAYSTRLPAIATSQPGVFVVNSAHVAHGTLNVNETLGLVELGLAALGAAPAAREPAAAR